MGWKRFRPRAAWAEIENLMGITLLKSGQTHRLQSRNAIIAANASHGASLFRRSSLIR